MSPRSSTIGRRTRWPLSSWAQQARTRTDAILLALVQLTADATVTCDASHACGAHAETDNPLNTEMAAEGDEGQVAETPVLLLRCGTLGLPTRRSRMFSSAARPCSKKGTPIS